MLPEGLQYNSISNIAAFIKSLGMNVVRLTYAIEMVDDVFEHNPNQTLKNTLINALGSVNGSLVLKEILKHNPQFNAHTTRLEVRIYGLAV
jgi:endoglucanase